MSWVEGKVRRLRPAGQSDDGQKAQKEFSLARSDPTARARLMGESMRDKFAQFVVNACREGESDFTYASPEEANDYLSRFNLEIRSLLAKHGREPIGEALWYIYGCLSNVARDALDPELGDKRAAVYLSMRTLYEQGFAIACEDCSGHSDLPNSGSFATACLMLWDMDSGLTYRSFHSDQFAKAHAFDLLEFALSLKHAACQESAFHGLGHRVDSESALAKPLIRAFLRRRDISPAIRKYAKECLTGNIL